MLSGGFLLCNSDKGSKEGELPRPSKPNNDRACAREERACGVVTRSSFRGIMGDRELADIFNVESGIDPPLGRTLTGERFEQSGRLAYDETEDTREGPAGAGGGVIIVRLRCTAIPVVDMPVKQGGFCKSGADRGGEQRGRFRAFGGGGGGGGGGGHGSHAAVGANDVRVTLPVRRGSSLKFPFLVPNDAVAGIGVGGDRASFGASEALQKSQSRDKFFTIDQCWHQGCKSTIMKNLELRVLQLQMDRCMAFESTHCDRSIMWCFDPTKYTENEHAHIEKCNVASDSQLL